MNLKRVIPFALCLSLLFSVTACKKDGVLPDTKDSNEIVGTVGEEKISAKEFKFYVNMEKSQIEAQEGIADKSKEEKKKFWEAEENAEKKQTVIENTFNNLTELKILLMSAKKDNVKLEQKDMDDINSSIEEIVKSEGNGNREAADKAIKEIYGVSIDDYKAFYQDYVLAYSSYASNQPGKIEINESDIKAEFEKNKEQYDKVTVKHVLVLTSDSETQNPLPEDEIAKKKLLADEILNKAKAGEDFEALVKQYSEDPGSKDQGGEYTFGRGEMVTEFEEWSFAAKEGDMGVVQTSYGFHVMKFIKRVDASLDAEKDGIKQKLQEEQFVNKMDEIKEKNPLVKKQEVIDKLDLF